MTDSPNTTNPRASRFGATMHKEETMYAAQPAGGQQ
jgi:hypothetical protein